MLLMRQSLWPWALGGLIANHSLLMAGSLWPRSSLLGKNWTRLPAPAVAGSHVAITIDDGPDPEVTPRLLDILDEHRASATFFCIGERVAAFPDLTREIARRGHAIENHSHRHLHRFSLLGPRAMATEIVMAQQIITDVVGVAPRFFRAPAGLRNPFLDPILNRLDLLLASWTRRGFDTVTVKPDVILGRLVRGLAAGDIMTLHDGHSARTPSGSPVLHEVMPSLLDSIAAANLTPITLRAALR
jgi:peptidoglycan/xylan/chitin deacetylase (PgdA/CDA1 family)